MTRISFERSGGFAGITLSGDVDVDALSDIEAQQARQLIEQAKLFELPRRIQSRSPMPDGFVYKITIEDGGKKRTITVGDQSAPPTLKPLLDFLTAQARKSL